MARAIDDSQGEFDEDGAGIEESFDTDKPRTIAMMAEEHRVASGNLAALREARERIVELERQLAVELEIQEVLTEERNRAWTERDELLETVGRQAEDIERLETECAQERERAERWKGRSNRLGLWGEMILMDCHKNHYALDQLNVGFFYEALAEHSNEFKAERNAYWDELEAWADLVKLSMRHYTERYRLMHRRAQKAERLRNTGSHWIRCFRCQRKESQYWHRLWIDHCNVVANQKAEIESLNRTIRLMSGEEFIQLPLGDGVIVHGKMVLTTETKRSEEGVGE